MSVSQSSIYEQTPALKQIQQQMQQCLENEGTISDKIGSIIQKIEQLTISESYRLIIMLSKQLKNNNSILRKYLSLLLSKQLLLSGYHRFYIFQSIRILPWIASTINFQAKKSEPQRVKAYIQQLSLKGNGQEIVQQRHCYKLFKFVSEFLHWFNIKLPNHLNCAFPYRSTFRRNFQQLSYQQNIRNFEYFSQEDFKKFQKNIDLLEAQSTMDIKDLSQFLVIQLNTLIEKRKQKSDLIFEMIKTGDSFCIKAIILQLRQLLEDSSKVEIVVKLMDHFMNVAQIQFVEMTKVYCLPLILQYILPVNIMEVGPLRCSKQTQNKLIDSVYLWNQMTKQLQLSNDLYLQGIRLFEQNKKPVRNVTIHDLSEFKTNLIDMKTINKDKFKFIHLKKQQHEVIKALGEPKSKLNVSAINELSEFKESKVQKNPFEEVLNVSKPQRFSVSNSNSISKQSIPPKKVIKFQSQKQEFYDQKVVPKKVQVQRSPPHDSFIAFEPSKTSKYSKISSENEIGFSQSSNTSESKKSDQSVVYFNNSDSYDSIKQSSGQVIFESPFNDKSSKTNKAKSDRTEKLKSSQSSNSVPGFEDDSKFIQSTYQFENSLVSEKSISSDSSKIVNFGTEGNNLPQVHKKPQFAFKKAKIEKVEKMRMTKDKYEQALDNILSSHASVDKQAYRVMNFDENEYSRIDKKDKDLRKTIELPKNLHHFQNVNDWESEEENMRKYAKSPQLFSEREVGDDKYSEIYRRTQRNLKSKRERESQLSKQEKKKALIVEQYNNDKVYELQRQIGRARQQKLKKKEELKKKQKEYNLLKQKSDPSLDKNMNQLKKQNQILELMLSEKNKEEKKQSRQIKPLNSNNQMQDFFLQNKVRGVFSISVTPYEKMFIKKILGSRCLLIKNDNMELGFNYSQRQNIVSLYLTLQKAFDTVQIKVSQNSIIFEKDVEMVLKNQPARSQLKIKRKVVGLRQKKKIPTFSQIINENSTNMFVFPEITISIYEEYEPVSQYHTVIPCSLYNLCTPIDINKEVIENLKTTKVIKTDKLLLNPEFVKNTKQKINKHFPSYMNLVGGWKIIGFHYPKSIFENRDDQFYKFRISELKNIQFQFFGDPHTLLTETLLKIMANSKR